MFKNNPKMKNLIIPSIGGIILATYQVYSMTNSTQTTLISILLTILILFGILVFINKITK